MSLSPDHEMLRSGSTRVLRDVPTDATAPIEIERLDALPYTMDGRPITSELRSAKDAGFRKGWERGWRDGHDHGYAEGKNEAFQQFTEALAPTLAGLEAAARRLSAADALVLERAERSFINFAMELVEALLGREMALAKQPVIDAVRRALALTPNRGDILIRLNPDDVAVVESVEHLMPGRTLTLVADPAIGRGDTVIEVGLCKIDAQLPSALARVRSILDGLN